jgi:hypothetical protein
LSRSSQHHSTLTVSHCTVSGNNGDFGGGGIFIAAGLATVKDSMFSNNSPDNIEGSFIDRGGNTFS